MKVSIEHIQDCCKEIREDRPYTDFPVLLELVHDGTCRITGPVSIDVRVCREHNQYRADGTVSMPIGVTCSRCLCDFEQNVASTLSVLFKPGVLQDDDRDEIELDERDLITTGFVGDEIDLASEIAEHLALAVPLKPLCSEHCQGLCHQCGAAKSAGPCGCSTLDKPSKFAVLKDFKVRS